MRVLKVVVHIADLQRVAKFFFAKRTVLAIRKLVFRTILNGTQRPSCRD